MGKHGPQPRTIAERLQAKILRKGPDECWPWTAARNSSGYGRLILPSGKWKRAHRLVYLTSVGPIPNGMLVCHTCDNPPCCNPKHLFLGSNYDNALDRVSKGRGPQAAQVKP